MAWEIRDFQRIIGRRKDRADWKGFGFVMRLSETKKERMKKTEKNWDLRIIKMKMSKMTASTTPKANANSPWEIVTDPNKVYFLPKILSKEKYFRTFAKNSNIKNLVSARIIWAIASILKMGREEFHWTALVALTILKITLESWQIIATLVNIILRNLTSFDFTLYLRSNILAVFFRIWDNYFIHLGNGFFAFYLFHRQKTMLWYHSHIEISIHRRLHLKMLTFGIYKPLD